MKDDRSSGATLPRRTAGLVGADLMPVNLRCACGYELQLQDDEAQELTWCPRCRTVLVQPQGLAAPQPLTRRGAAPGSGGGGSVGVRILAILGFTLVMGLSRVACAPRPRYEAPEPPFEFRDFRGPQMRDLPEIVPPDGQRDPVFRRLPDQPNPFAPEERGRRPGGDQRDNDPDDP
jgi:hypothetical protein